LEDGKEYKDYNRNIDYAEFENCAEKTEIHNNLPSISQAAQQIYNKAYLSR